MESLRHHSFMTNTYYEHNLLSMAIVLNMKELAKKLYLLDIYDMNSIVKVANQYNKNNSPIIYYENFGKPCVQCVKPNKLSPNLNVLKETYYACAPICDTLIGTNILYLAILHEHTELVEMITEDLKKNNMYDEMMNFRPGLIPVETDDNCADDSVYNTINPDSYSSLKMSELIAKKCETKKCKTK